MMVAVMNDFLLNALLAGTGLALIAGPLGSFVVWRRMAYFGDTLAHSALLGVALGYLFAIDLNLAVIATCVAIALLVVLLREHQRFADDTLLGILAHSALSLGLIALAVMETVRVDLVSYLFGDVLAVTTRDLVWIYSGCLVAGSVLMLIWRPLLRVTIHDELARVEGVNAMLVIIVFMLLLAIVIALAMKVVGILLITSLLIIPPAVARRFTATPESMAILAAVIGCLSVYLGLAGSLVWDLPTGPAIVVGAAVLFMLSQLVPERGLRRLRKR